MFSLKKRSITTITIIALVTVITILTSVEGLTDYKNKKAQLYNDLENRLEMTTNQLSTALQLGIWNLDQEQIKDTLLSMMKLPEIFGLIVNTNTNNTYIMARDQNWAVQTLEKPFSTENLFSKTESVVYSGEKIGSAQVFVSGNFVESELTEYLHSTIVEITLLDIILILLIYAINWKIILKPIQDIEQYASTVTIDDAPNPLVNHEFAGEIEDLRISIQKMVGFLASKNLELQKSLNEKELLLREIYHRTKNNMQVISGLLFLQDRITNHPAVSDTFKEMANRIHAMSLVHEKLYQTTNLSSLSLKEFTSDIANAVMGSYGYNEKQIEVVLNVDPIYLQLESAITCGLVLNELLSNSFKHAFRHSTKDGGKIVIEIHKFDEKIDISYSDNGTPFPDHFDFKAQKSMGTRLMIMLVEKQGKGSVSLDVEKKKFTMQFLEAQYKARI